MTGHACPIVYAIISDVPFNIDSYWEMPLDPSVNVTIFTYLFILFV